MDDENQIKFNSVDLMWLFSVDLSKRVKDMDGAIQNIYDCDLCEGVLKYYTPEERNYNDEIGIVEIKTVDDIKRQEYSKLLYMLLTTDFLNLDEEFFEGKNYARFILKDFRLKIPILKEFYDCKVLLTISKLGIAVFTFWIHIEEELNSKDIAKLQLIPLFEDEKITAKIPIELVKENGYINQKFLNVFKLEEAKGNKYTLIEDVRVGAILNVYWYAIVNRISNLEFKSTSSLEEKLRYESYYVLPFVIIRSTIPQYKYADEIIKDNPRQIYQILSQTYDFDYQYINLDTIGKVFEHNLTIRRDIAYFNDFDSVLLIFSSSLKNNIKTQQRVTPLSIGLEYQRVILEAFVILEILQVQRLYFGLLTKKLNRPIANMNPKQISMMRSYLTKVLDMYFGNVARNSLAIKRLEYGRNIFKIEEEFEILNQKMKLLGKAIDSFTELKNSFFQVAFALILGIVPLFYIFSPFTTPILDALFPIFITVGIVIFFYLSARFYWNHLKKKEII